MMHSSSKKAGLTALAVATLLWAVPASAEPVRTYAQIPFEFMAGSDVMPAGQYEVTVDDFSRVVLRNTTESKMHYIPLSIHFVTRTSADLTAGKLRFEQHDGTMYLTVAWAPGHEDGRAVSGSQRMFKAMQGSGSESGSVAATSDIPLK